MAQRGERSELSRFFSWAQIFDTHEKKYGQVFVKGKSEFKEKLWAGALWAGALWAGASGIHPKVGFLNFHFDFSPV